MPLLVFTFLVVRAYQVLSGHDDIVMIAHAAVYKDA